MINNNELYNAYSQVDRDLSAYIEVGNKKIKFNDKLKSFKLNAKADKDGMWIGQAIPKMLKFEVIKKDLNVSIKKGDAVKLFHGIKINSSVQHQLLGTFYISNIENKEDKETISYMAYDKLYDARNIEMGTIGLPTTINLLIERIGLKLGVSVDKTNILFGSFSITKALNTQDKTVLDYILMIAQANLCFAYITVDNKLAFKRLHETDKTINYTVAFQLRNIGELKSYNSVVLSRQPQNDDVIAKDDVAVANNGLSELKIANNPILDQNREYFAPFLLNIAKNIKYNGLDNLKILSNPLFEVGDIVIINNKKYAILEHEIDLARSFLSSKISKKSETDYKKAKGIEQSVRETYLYVDKVKGEIVSSVNDIKSDVDGTSSDLKSFKLQTNQSLQQKVSLTEYNANKQVVNNKFSSINQEVDAISSNVTAIKKKADGTATELSSFKVQTNQGLQSRVLQSTYNSNNNAIQQQFTETNQTIDTIRLQVDSKGKYRNFVANSDSWTEAPVTTSSDAFTSVRDSDNSVEFGLKLANRDALFRFSLDRHEANGKNTLFFSNANFIGSGIGSLTFRLQDENFNNVSNIQVISQATEVYNFVVTKKAKYLVFGIRSTSNNTSVRIYKESIALVDGQISSLKWDNTYLNDSGSMFEMKLNKITLKASQIDLHGLVTANGGFKINLDGSVEAKAGKIGGFNIRDKVLESGSGDSYIRISGTSNYTPILIGGNTWESANFGVSTKGIIKAKNPQLNGGSFNNGRLDNANVYDSTVRGEHYGHGEFGSGELGNQSFSISDEYNVTKVPSMFIPELYFNTLRTFSEYTSGGGGEMVTAYIQGRAWRITNSDIRLKENIEEIGYEYNDFLFSMPVAKYNYISNPGKLEIGMIANLIDNLYPKSFTDTFLFKDKKTGLYGLNYEKLTPYLIKSVQYLNNEIKALKNEIKRKKDQ